MFGERLSHATLEFIVSHQANVDALVNPVGQGTELDIFPWLRFLPNETCKTLKQLSQQYGRVFSHLINGRKVRLGRVKLYMGLSCSVANPGWVMPAMVILTV